MDIKEPKFEPKSLIGDYKYIFNNQGHYLAVLFTIDFVIYLLYRYHYIVFYAILQVIGCYFGLMCFALIAWILIRPILNRIIIPIIFTIIFMVNLFIEAILFFIGKLNDRYLT